MLRIKPNTPREGWKRIARNAAKRNEDLQRTARPGGTRPNAGL